MYSCTKLKELNLCQGCGWDRNPVTYYKSRIKEGGENKELRLKAMP
jgi:DNA primase large subunit